MTVCDLSIVIVHYCTPELLRRLLESLRLAGFDRRTVVVDCASPGFDSCAFECEFAARFLVLPANRGYAFAVNKGVAQTSGELILLLNADVLLTGRDIERLEATWRELDRPAALGPVHRNARGIPQLTFGAKPTAWNEWRRRRLEYALRRGSSRATRRMDRTCCGTRTVSWVSGSCILTSREVLRAVGPWDEGYFLYFEDMDWCLRAGRLGYGVYHTGDVSIVHEHGASVALLGDSSRVIYRQSQLRFFSSHWGLLRRDLLYAYLRYVKGLSKRDLTQHSSLVTQGSIAGQVESHLSERSFCHGRRAVLHVVASLEGGAAEHVRLLARGQIRRGWEVWVCADLGRGTTSVPQTWSDIPVACCEFDREGLWRGVRRLRRLVAGGGWSVVHLHGHRAGAVGRVAMLLLPNRPRVVMTYHGYHPPHYRKWLNRVAVTALERLLRGLADHFIAVSPSTARDLLRFVGINPARLSTVLNAVEAEKYAKSRTTCRDEARKSLGLEPGEFTVMYVGRIHRQKGLEYFLQALRELRGPAGGSVAVRRLVHNIRGIVVGDGPERGKIELIMEQLPQRACLFLGHRNDVPKLLAAADLLVLPSLWEGCPLVVLEAWAAGVPVVATDVPGTSDLITDGVNGFLVPPGNPIALSTAIARIHRQPAWTDRLIRGGRTSLAEYDLDGMIDQTLAVYLGGVHFTPASPGEPASRLAGQPAVSAPLLNPSRPDPTHPRTGRRRYPRRRGYRRRAGHARKPGADGPHA